MRESEATLQSEDKVPSEDKDEDGRHFPAT